MKSSWKHPLCSNQGHSHRKFHVHPLLRTRTRIRSCSKFHCDSRPRLSAPTRSGYVKFFSKWLFDTNLALSLQPFKPLNEINKSTEKHLLNFCLLQTTKEEGKGFAQCIKALIAALFLLSTSCIISSQQWLRWLPSLAGWKIHMFEGSSGLGLQNIVSVYLVTHKVEIECFHLKGNNTWPGGKHLCSWIDMEKKHLWFVSFKKTSMEFHGLSESSKEEKKTMTTSSFHK